MGTICESGAEQHFVKRVYKYPLVSDTCEKVSDYYFWAKGKNPVVKKGLECAEYTLQTAYSKAQPVIHTFDSQSKFECWKFFIHPICVYCRPYTFSSSFFSGQILLSPISQA